MITTMLRKGRTLSAMVERGAELAEIASWLDELAPATRVKEALALRGATVSALFARASSSGPLSIDEVVARSTPAGATITFEGRSSLPMFSAFRRRFTRTADGLVFGCDLHSRSWLIGPGYFSVRSSQDPGRGGVLFDFAEAPPFEPAGWPRYQPNETGARRLAYGGRCEYVRFVAKAVLVGEAYRRGAPAGRWFVLVRR